MTSTDMTQAPEMREKYGVGRRMQRDHRFYLTLSLVCALLIFAGFAPSYYLKNVLHAPPPLSAMSHVHGVVFTAWVVLFVVQVSLIGYGNPSLHRRLGVLGAALFGVVAAVGTMTAINAGRLGHAPPGSPPGLIFMAVPIMAIIATTILVLAALWNRARREAHMRYMMAALIAMTPPATHRLALGAGLFTQALWIGFTVMDLLLAVAILYDLRTHKRVHPAYRWSALIYAAAQLGIAWAYSSPAWLPIANWLTQT